MILGVALVVDELHKGQRLVFRYPESIPTSLPLNAEKGLSKLYNQYFAISQDNFAKLFRPKISLLNKVLELTIDDLHFVSYPCQCQTTNDTDLSDSKLPLTVPLRADSTLGTIDTSNVSSNPVISNYSLSMFNVVIVSITSRAMCKICPDLKFKCQLRSLCVPGADPVAAALALRDTPYGVCSQTLKRVIEVVSNALSAEEKRTRYVTRQVSVILQLIDIANKSRGQAREVECGDQHSSQQQQTSGNTSPHQQASLPAPHSQLEAVFSTQAPPSYTLAKANSVDRTDGADESVLLTGELLFSHQDMVVSHGGEGGHSRSGSCPPTVCEVVCFERTNRSVSNASITSARSSSDATSSTYVPSQHSRPHSPVNAALSVAEDALTLEKVAVNVSVIDGAESSFNSSGSNRQSPLKTSPTSASSLASNRLLSITSDEVTVVVNSSFPSPVASASSSVGVGGGSKLSLSNALSAVSVLSAMSAGQMSPGPPPTGSSEYKPVSSSSSSVGTSDESSGAAVLQGWGLHLLGDVLMRSTLADELRLLFHSLAGSQSVGIVFNGAQTCTAPLYCKDVRQCEDSVRNNCSHDGACGLSERGGSNLRNSQSHGSLHVLPPSVSGASSAHSHRHRGSFVANSSAAVTATTNSLYDHAKQRGINLETETALLLADVDTVLVVLRRLLGGSVATEQRVEQQQSHLDEGLLSYLESGRLRVFLEAADPTLSFFDLSLALNEPVEELVVMASQLQAWGLLEVVTILCNQSVFRIHREAPTQRGSRVARAFESLLVSLRIDFEGGVEEGSDAVELSRTGKSSRSVLSSSSSTSGAALRKSHSYSVNSAQASRVRADSDGNVKHVSSSGAISNPRNGSVAARGVMSDDDQSSVSPVRRPSINKNTSAATSSAPLSLDALDIVSLQFCLSAVLSLFDGSRSVREAIQAMERPLQRYGVNIVLFLLRWHMLSESCSYVLNLSRLPLYNSHEEMALTRGGVVPTNSSVFAGGHQSAVELAQLSSAAVHSALQQLSVREHVIYDKIAPFVHNNAISHKTLSEVLWSAQVSEVEFNKVLSKLTYLKIHKN